MVMEIYNSDPLCANATMQLYNETFLSNPSPSNPELYAQLILCILFFTFGVIHVVVSFTMFAILHSNSKIPRLHIRSIVLVLITCAAVTLHTCIAFLPGFAIPIPGYVLHPAIFFIVGLSILPIPVRLINFYGRYVFALAIAQMKIYESSEQDTVVGHKQDVENPSFSFATNDLSKADVAIAPKLKDADEVSVSPSVASSRDTHLMGREKNRNRIISIRNLVFLKVLASWKAQLMVFIICLIPLVLVIIANFALIPTLSPSANCYGVDALEANVIVLSLYGAIAILCSIYAGLSVRKFLDPFGIATEARQMSQYGGAFALLCYILETQITELPEVYNFDYLISVGENTMLFTVTGYQIYLAVKERYSTFSFTNLLDMLNESIEILRSKESDTFISKQFHIKRLGSNSEADFADPEFMRIINSSKEVDDFERFLIGELSAENLRMYVECRRWELTFYDMTDSQRRARAKKIVELFVDIGSLFEVNLPSDIRNEIINKHDDKDAALTPDLFTKSQLEMLGILYGAYQRYTKKKEKESR